MNVSLEYLQRCAARTGFRVEPLEKVVRLGVMAVDVARHPAGPGKSAGSAKRRK